jgi:D,D-heptose 1,7-bisphosphate phosphatase
MTARAPAVFLDRDGTLIEEAGYLDSLERMQLFPWTVDALRLLGRAGYRRVVVTNQSGIALGLFDEAFVRRTHETLSARLDESGAAIDAFYYCPHHPHGHVEALRQACACRKPGAAMLEQAAADLDVDLARSYAIGDRWTDVQLAATAGLRGGILLRTGHGRSAEQRPIDGVTAAHVADDLIAAVGWILRQDAV